MTADEFNHGQGRNRPPSREGFDTRSRASHLGQEGFHRRLASFAVGIGGVCLAALDATVFVMTRGLAGAVWCPRRGSVATATIADFHGGDG